MVEDKICADTTSTTYLDALSGKEGLFVVEILHTKGQLILKGIRCVFNFSKK